MKKRKEIIGNLIVKAIRWAVLLAVAWVIWKVVPVYGAALRFNFAVAEACKTGATGRVPVDEIRGDILFKADQLELPIRQENIKLDYQGRRVRARVTYQVPIELGPRQFVLRFHATADERPLVVVESGEEAIRKALD